MWSTLLISFYRLQHLKGIRMIWSQMKRNTFVLLLFPPFLLAKDRISQPYKRERKKERGKVVDSGKLSMNDSQSCVRLLCYEKHLQPFTSLFVSSFFDVYVFRRQLFSRIRARRKSFGRLTHEGEGKSWIIVQALAQFQVESFSRKRIFFF